MKKKKWIYNVITIIILVVPTNLYLFLSATIFNIDVHAEVKLPKGYEIQYELLENSYFFYDINARARYEGVTVYYNHEVGQWGFEARENNVIKINNDYIAIGRDDQYNLIIKDIKAFSLARKEGFSIPFSLVISIISFVFVGLVVTGKMKFLKWRYRTATLVSLILGTLILTGINMIVKDMLRVFQIFTGSFAGYYILYLIQNGIIVEEKAAGLEEKIKDLL